MAQKFGGTVTSELIDTPNRVKGALTNYALKASWQAIVSVTKLLKIQMSFYPLLAQLF
ncbi:1296_t:CDS:2 [Dentiscutata heterogama]|uniref:1296_t:CDS:1 n=1 Tax=Dentiscutata heterogama TaxID=1316150 RepID=A0ACA9KRA6_9GLOM|nr:1296_t:CDS:2 [Dentiscutata heterogama]